MKEERAVFFDEINAIRSFIDEQSKTLRMIDQTDVYMFLKKFDILALTYCSNSKERKRLKDFDIFFDDFLLHKEISKLWHTISFEMMQNVAYPVGNIPQISKGPFIFVSFHYGPYVFISPCLESIGIKHKLVWDRPSFNASKLEAAQKDFDKKYLDSNNPHVFRRIYSNLRDGKSILIFTDVPTNKGEGRYFKPPFLGNFLNILSSIYKFSFRLNVPIIPVMSEFSSYNKRVAINFHESVQKTETQDFDAYLSKISKSIYNKFEAYVTKAPHVWDHSHKMEEMGYVVNSSLLMKTKKATYIKRFFHRLLNNSKDTFNKNRYFVFISKDKHSGFLYDVFKQNLYKIDSYVAQILNDLKYKAISPDRLRKLIGPNEYRLFLKNQVLIPKH